jgi:hypothetical protein
MIAKGGFPMLKSLAVLMFLPMVMSAEEAKKPAEAPKPAPAAAAAAAPAAAPAKESKATEVKVGTGLEKKEIVGAAEEFKIAPDTKIWVWAKVSGLAADAKVTLTFSKGDKEAFRKELTAAGSPWRVNAYKTFRAGDSGDWTAKALGPDGAELGSVKFKVDVAK